MTAKTDGERWAGDEREQARKTGETTRQYYFLVPHADPTPWRFPWQFRQGPGEAQCAMVLPLLYSFTAGRYARSRARKGFAAQPGRRVLHRSCKLSALSYRSFCRL